MRAGTWALRRLQAAPRCARLLSGAPAGPAAAAAAEEPMTHFGFQTVADADKAGRVAGVFHNVADTYDKMNDLMSGGLHRLWKDEFVRQLAPAAGAAGAAADSYTHLDVAGGTGDVAFRVLRALRAAAPGPGPAGGRVIVCDINESMLAVGRQRAEQQGLAGPELDWLHGDAEQLALPDNSVDSYTIAFGIRNVTHVDRAIAEAYRVLKVGGRFMCLEFSRVHPLLAQAYDSYSFSVIPLMGQLVADDRESYQYLVESIRQFPSQRRFKEMIEAEGFQAVRFENLTFGVAAIHSGIKL